MAACVGIIGDDGPAGGLADPVAQQTVPAPGGLRRLTARQYLASLRLLFGDEAAALAEAPEDAQLHGLDVIGSAELALGNQGVATYEASSRAVAALLVQDLGTLLPCSPSGPADDGCFRSFVQQLGRLLWRRPLTDDETALLTTLGVDSATHPDVNDFAAGCEQIVSALLQSPNFVYAVEIGVPDPADPSKRWLDDYELVTRMSLFLLGAVPDAALLDEAEQRDLSDVREVEALARRMLDRERAPQAFADLFDELYRLRELGDSGKNDQIYPLWSDALAASMRMETLRLFDDIVWQRDADARELFTADYTFVDAELARLYGLDPVDGVQRVSLPPEQQRAGVLGHASWLSRMSHPATTSPTRRGLFVRTVMMCDVIPPPPPGIDTALPEPGMTGASKKEQLAMHQEDPQCAGCHVPIDGIGLALERYDGVGAYRESDGGAPFDTAMEVDDLGSFASASELGQLLADDPRTMDCLVQHLFRGSMGHRETEGERVSIASVSQAFADGGYRVRELLLSLVTSPAFRLVADPK